MKKWLCLIMALTLLLCGCSPDGNQPYEPDTPAPAAHEGEFVSEHGVMRFNGDGKSLEMEFDTYLSELTGLPDGRHEGTYVFLSGDLPPNGSIPVRYDVAHEVRITVDGNYAVIGLGIAAEDGSSAQVGVNTVTPERIPLLFSENGRSFHVLFEKESQTK
jgi:hypothetical protein